MRTDAAYKSDFYLAHELKRPLAEIRDMPNDEYLDWVMYFNQIAQDRQAAGR